MGNCRLHSLIVSCGVHRELESLSSLLLTRFDKIWFVNVSVLRLKRGLLNPISHSTVLVCHKTLNIVTSVSRGKPKHHAAPYRNQRITIVATLFSSLSIRSWPKMRIHWKWTVVCALGDITLSDSPTSDSFDLSHEEETTKHSCRSN